MAKKKSRMVDVFYDEIAKTSNKLSDHKPLTDKMRKKLQIEMERARKNR
jgi:hypothetical protein